LVFEIQLFTQMSVLFSDKFFRISTDKKPRLGVFYFVPIIILAYWQIAFLQCSLKWDVIDVVFPFRFHFSECIQSGNFPFWNPYQQTGVPFYADLQVPTYYPELLLVSLFTGYGICTMNILFVLYVFISAVGAYKLSFYFNRDHIASFFTGMVYALSGYTVAHGQHFFLLVGAAWMPFVILYYLKLNEDRQLINVFKCGVFLFLMFSGGYQAISIFLLYFLLLLFFYFIIREIKKKNIRNAFSIFRYNIYLAFVTILFCLPLIISTLDVLFSVERLESGVNIQKALSGGLSPGSLLSFIFPFATVKNNEFFGTDISVRNIYFGIIPLIFFLTAVFKKRSILEYLFLVFGIIVFTSAMGGFLPVREFMFRYIPFMNLYHTTPYVSIFAILVFAVISGNFFAQLREDKIEWHQKIKFVTGLISLLVVTVFVFSCTQTDFSNFSFFKEHKNFQEFLDHSTFYEHLFIQSAIQLFFCIAFLFLIVFFKKIKKAIFLIVFLTGMDLVVSTQLNIFYTAADVTFKPLRMDRDLSLYPKGFPVPVDDKLIYNDQHTLVPPFWRNTNIFSKQVSFDSFSSFELKNYSKLDDDYPNLRRAVLNNKLVYLSDKILPLSQFSDSIIKPETHSKYLFFDDLVFNGLRDKSISANVSDRVEIKSFSPNKVMIETSTENDQYLTILQTNYKGWSAFVDDVEVPVYTSNFNYKTIFLPKGEHLVRFRFKNNAVLYSYIFSNLFFAGVLLFFALNLFIKKTDSRFIPFLIVPVILITLSVFLVMRLRGKETNENTHQQIDKKWGNLPSAIHIEESFESTLADSTTVFSGNKSLYVDSLTEYTPAREIVFTSEKLERGTLRYSSQIFPKTDCAAVIVCQLVRNNEQIDWSGARLGEQIEKINSWNRVEYFKNYYDLKPNDRLRVYIWNKGKTAMYIDDVKVDFYEF